MSKGTLIYLNKFKENLQRELGEDIAQKVLAGSEGFTESTKLEKVAVWMNGALARLGNLVGSRQLSDFFQACGTRWAEANLKGALAARKRRQSAPSLEAFIDAELAGPATAFSRMAREGADLAIYYTPANIGRLRCFCPLMRKLPDDQTASVAYYQCSRAFTKRYWEVILEHPVQVELTQSALMGDQECKFLLHWSEL